MIDFKLSKQSTKNVTKLLKKNREGTLTPEEKTDLDGYVRLETVIGLLKARAWDHLEKNE